MPVDDEDYVRRGLALDKCRHEGCTWAAPGDTVIKRRRAALRHEFTIPAHAAHFRTHGASCERCLSNLESARWVVNERGALTVVKVRVLGKRRRSASDSDDGSEPAADTRAPAAPGGVATPAAHAAPPLASAPPSAASAAALAGAAALAAAIAAAQTALATPGTPLPAAPLVTASPAAASMGDVDACAGAAPMAVSLPGAVSPGVPVPPSAGVSAPRASTAAGVRVLAGGAPDAADVESSAPRRKRQRTLDETMLPATEPARGLEPGPTIPELAPLNTLTAVSDTVFFALFGDDAGEHAAGATPVELVDRRALGFERPEGVPPLVSHALLQRPYRPCQLFVFADVSA